MGEETCFVLSQQAVEAENKNIKMALPHRPSGISSTTQEGDYGIEHGMKQRAPVSGFSHPLEESERTYRQRQEEQRLTSARRAFGTGFILHQRHTKAAAGCAGIGHLGFLPQSNAHLHALTGQDLDFDFMDTLAQQPEVTRNPHLMMEQMHHKPM